MKKRTDNTKKTSLSTRNYHKYLLLALLVVFLDLITKLLVTRYMELNQSISIIPKIFHLTYITNTGSLFGTFQNLNVYFIWLSVIIIGIILYTHDQFNKKESILFALITGAIIGNLIDRIMYGHVIDFLDFRIWPVFNIADSVLTVCIILLLIFMFKKK